MKRVLLVLAALALFVPATSAGARPQLSCAHPTGMNMTDGKYTTAFTVQYDANHFANMDAWSPDATSQQTMQVCSPSDWTATVSQHGQLAVHEYPDGERRFTDWAHCSTQPALSSLTKLKETYAGTGQRKGAWDFADDIYVDGSPCGLPSVEIMVWHRWFNVSVPAAQLHPTIAGKRYDVYSSGPYIQVRQVTQSDAGSENLLAILRYLQSHGLVRPAATLQFVQEGYEFLQGTNVHFSLSKFNVTAS